MKAYENKVFSGFVAFYYFMGNTGKTPVDVLGSHHRRVIHKNNLLLQLARGYVNPDPCTALTSLSGLT
jgi:hypothetical protein